MKAIKPWHLILLAVFGYVLWKKRDTRAIDPITGFRIDPTTGKQIDPLTGQLLAPANKLDGSQSSWTW